MLILNIVFTSWQIFKLLSGGTTCPAIFHPWQYHLLRRIMVKLLGYFTGLRGKKREEKCKC